MAQMLGHLLSQSRLQNVLDELLQQSASPRERWLLLLATGTNSTAAASSEDDLVFFSLAEFTSFSVAVITAPSRQTIRSTRQDGNSCKSTVLLRFDSPWSGTLHLLLILRLCTQFRITQVELSNHQRNGDLTICLNNGPDARERCSIN